MQIHQLKSHTVFRRSKRIGRGGKRGTTSGRGTKGQGARAGAKIRPAIRDIMKKIPKLRGYKFRSFHPRPVILNLNRVAAIFPDGASVDGASLLKSGLIRRIKGKIPAMKILGSAKVAKRLHIRGIGLSAAARERVREAGGSVN